MRLSAEIKHQRTKANHTFEQKLSLSASDCSNHSGLQPRTKAAESMFPPIQTNQQSPVAWPHLGHNASGSEVTQMSVASSLLLGRVFTWCDSRTKMPYVSEVSSVFFFTEADTEFH